MAKFIMMMGIPAAGKSTIATEKVEMYDAYYLSSDLLRIELYNDIKHQAHNKELFQIMNAKAAKWLEKGVNVLYDATNLSAARRKRLLQDLIYDEAIVYWIDTPIDTCIKQDLMRENTVGEEVILKMAKKLEEPTYNEGWDKIFIIREEQHV